jgi:hypothetical protein
MILRQATNNPDVLRRIDAKIKEAERSLSYFEDTLQALQARKLQLSQRDDSAGSAPQGGTTPGQRNMRPGDRDRQLPEIPPTELGGQNAGPMPGSQNANAYGVGTRVKNYTNLDLIRADTPHITAKISRMLHQLEFKLQVEMQYKKGIDKMVKLYQADGDKKSRADAESKRVESERKIQLLQSALKRYKTLHILDDVEDEETRALALSLSFMQPHRCVCRGSWN